MSGFIRKLPFLDRFLHKAVPLGFNHIPYNWSFADSTARTAAGNYVTADLGKFARQRSDDTIWMLTATTPTWVAVGSSAAGGDLLSTLLNAEVSVTGATTATISKMHVCSGTSADYTVGLPAVSGNTGKLIGFRMDQALTKMVTLDGNASETIDGATTRVMWAGETAILYCDGVTWTKIAGKTIPLYATMRLTSGTPSAAQSLAHATSVKVLLNQIDSQVMSMGDTTNKRINIKRGGTYAVSGLVYISASAAFTRAIGAVYKNAVQVFSGETSCSTSTTYPWCQPEGRLVLAAADYLELYAYQQNGGSAGANLYGDPTGASNILSVMEIPSW